MSRKPMNTSDLPPELVRVVDAACWYVELYWAELENMPEGGTSRELLDAVNAWRPRPPSEERFPVGRVPGKVAEQ